MKPKEFEKCAEINDVFDTYLWEPISFIFAKPMAKNGWSPNVASIISMILGVSGGVLFAFHNFLLNVIGAILFILSIIFDDVDGQIARINHSGSLFGRCFDGFCDNAVCLATYIGLCIHLMSDNIPFTNTPWSWWIFPAVFPIGFYCHTKQARVIDFSKNAYMYFIGAHSELSYSGNLKEQFKKEKMNWFKRLLFKIYVVYTKQQEKETPRTQELLKKIQENGNVVPKSVSLEFKKHVFLLKFANIEHHTFRALIFIILLLVGQGFWVFPILVFILEPIILIIQWRFSRISKKACEEFLNEI